MPHPKPGQLSKLLCMNRILPDPDSPSSSVPHQSSLSREFSRGSVFILKDLDGRDNVNGSALGNKWHSPLRVASIPVL